MRVSQRKRVGNVMLLVLLVLVIAGVNYMFANLVVEGSRIGWRNVLIFNAIEIALFAAIIIPVNLSHGLPWHGRIE